MYDSKMDKIQQNFVRLEEETRVIHFIWERTILCGGGRVKTTSTRISAVMRGGEYPTEAETAATTANKTAGPAG